MPRARTNERTNACSFFGITPQTSRGNGPNLTDAYFSNGWFNHHIVMFFESDKMCWIASFRLPSAVVGQTWKPDNLITQAATFLVVFVPSVTFVCLQFGEEVWNLKNHWRKKQIYIAATILGMISEKRNLWQVSSDQNFSYFRANRGIYNISPTFGPQVPLKKWRF